MAEIPIITYHSIDNSKSSVSTSPSEFERHLAYLTQAGYESIALSEAVQSILDGKELPMLAVIITFDDGYRNNLTHALPLLQKYGFSATVFVATGYCGKENTWGDQHQSIPRLKMMNPDEIRSLRDAGIEIGAHTRTHPRLSRIDPEIALVEMEGSKMDLEQILGDEIEVFSYPYGDYNETVREYAAQLFRTAIGNRPGRLRADSDLHAIDRINACGRLFGVLPLALAGLSSFTGYLVTKKLIDFVGRSKR